MEMNIVVVATGIIIMIIITRKNEDNIGTIQYSNLQSILHGRRGNTIDKTIKKAFYFSK